MVMFKYFYWGRKILSNFSQIYWIFFLDLLWIHNRDDEQVERGISYILIRMENRCGMINHILVKTRPPWHDEHKG